MKSIHNAKFLRTRKMLMVLPALTLPFITIIFWLLGGGQHSNDKSAAERTGLNLQLPDAIFDENKNTDKLSFYNKAEKDSIKREDLLRSDPNYEKAIDEKTSLLTIAEQGYDPSAPYSHLNASPYSSGSARSSEDQIYKKLNAINKQISQPDPQRQTTTDLVEGDKRAGVGSGFSQEVDRLQNMMMIMNDKNESDPEMMQLNTTLEKILDVQHPERVQQRIKTVSLKNKRNAYMVNRIPRASNISILDSNGVGGTKNDGFYSLQSGSHPQEENTVSVVVHQDQTLADGAVVKMRLLNNIYINGQLVPEGNFVFGIAHFSHERIAIEVNSIRFNGSILPVEMEAFDMDGLPGVNMPASLNRDVARESTRNGIQSVEISSIDPSLKAQAAATGISAAKQLFSKKLKQVKVFIKSGYQLLLKNKNIDQ